MIRIIFERQKCEKGYRWSLESKLLAILLFTKFANPMNIWPVRTFSTLVVCNSSPWLICNCFTGQTMFCFPFNFHIYTKMCVNQQNNTRLRIKKAFRDHFSQLFIFRWGHWGSEKVLSPSHMSLVAEPSPKCGSFNFLSSHFCITLPHTLIVVI